MTPTNVISAEATRNSETPVFLPPAPTTQPNFNHIARPYRFLEYLTLGPILQRTRTHFLPLLIGRKQALILGDGDGRFVSALLRAYPSIQADAVDTSATMLALLRQRCERITSIRLRTHHHSVLEHLPSAHTDLVTAHFLFDCLTQPELNQLIAKYTPNTRKDCLWLVSDFRIPTGPLRLPAQLYIRALYLAFRLLTGLRITHLPDHESPLRDAGLTRTHQHLALFGILTTEIWERI
jgi:SAM-dependent methyltransferase